MGRLPRRSEPGLAAYCVPWISIFGHGGVTWTCEAGDIVVVG